MEKMKKLLLLFCFVWIGNTAFSQHKVQSPLRDLEVQVKSCSGFNGEVEVGLLITSLDKDQRLFFEQVYSNAVDDEGNQYDSSKIYFKTGGERGSGFYNFPADVPIKMTVTIKEVDEKATVMKLINLGLMKGEYGTMTPLPIKIKDVTINKE